MDDLREKVINGLEYEINSAAFYGLSYKDCVSVSLLKNALSLLKEQEVPDTNAGKWFSVKDGLPKRPDNWPRCEIKRCYFLVALESGCVESLGFEFDDMRWHVTGSPVTHWMPLPEPPKEET